MKRAAAGAVGLATVGVEGAAAGSPTLEDRSIDLATAESAFEAHAGDLLAQLAEEGVLDGGLEALPTDRALPAGALVDDPEGTAFLALADRPDVIRAVKHVGGGVLRVSVRPETGRADAAFEPAGADVRYRHFDDHDAVKVEQRDVSTTADCSCDEVICPYGSGLTRTCCDGDDCWVESCC